MNATVDERGRSARAEQATGTSAETITLLVVAPRSTQRRIDGVLDQDAFTVTAATEPPLTIEAAAEVCRDLKRAPDVVLLAGGKELYAPGGSIELLRTLLPESRLLLLAACAERDVISRALRAGVGGVLELSRLEFSLNAVLRAVHAGQLCLPVAMVRRIDTRSFSTRERQVLDLVTRGLTNAQIASRLYLSESTVKSHLASSFRKLGLSSRAEAAVAWGEVLDDETERPRTLSRLAADGPAHGGDGRLRAGNGAFRTTTQAAARSPLGALLAAS